MTPTNTEPSRYSIAGVVDRFETTWVVIKMDDGQFVRWPVKQLPDDIAVGTPVRLMVLTSSTEQAERQQMAKTILNELLQATPTEAP